MANEAQVRVSLQIRKGNLDYRSNPVSFQASVAEGVAGPWPGLVVATPNGTNVDPSGNLSSGPLDVRGNLVFMQNLSTTETVEWGMYVNPTGTSVPDGFLPMGEMLPGEIAHFRLAESFAIGESGTGTEFLGNYAYYLHFRTKSPSTSNADVRLDMFGTEWLA